jgi:DsbC/DsbD-like thiol-disulfide interchange protein
VVAVSLALLSPGLAQTGASPWSEHSGASLRLIDGGRDAAGILHAGLEIRLPAGFKTYWRSPGDSGVPPVVSFDGSQNLGMADVLFPAPVSFADGAGGQSWGYRADVVLPVRVTPVDTTQPVVLVAKVDYAVCEKLCIPVQAEATLVVGGASPPDAALATLVAAHRARVPVKSGIGDSGGLAVVAVRPGDRADRFVLDVRSSAADGLAVFFEAPPGWFVETGVPVAGAEGVVSVPATVVEKPRDAASGHVNLVVTAVAAESAIEVALIVPAP